MKINWNKRYNTIAVYIILVMILVISFYLGVTKFEALGKLANNILSVIKPFIIGLCMAYVLNFVLKFYESKLDRVLEKKKGTKVNRAISIVMTYITLLIVIMLFFRFVFPQVTQSLTGIIMDLPNILDKIYTYIDKSIINNIDLPHSTRVAINQKLVDTGRRAIDIATNLAPQLANFFFSIVYSVWNAILGLIISIYILADKENFYGMSKKFVFALFKESTGERILYITRLSNDVFGKFIIGKIIDSCIIAFITFVILYFAKMPYLILLTFIIGVTNIIPFFGPFIGAIPSIIIVLTVDPIKALWLIVIIFVIQQLDGNVIGPRILGDSIGISAFWILFSLLIAGKILGIVGLVVGVPIFAVIHTLVRESIDAKLVEKGLPLERDEYLKK